MTTSQIPSPSIGFYYHVRDTRLKIRPLPDISQMILKGSRGLDALTREARRLYRIQEEAYIGAGSPEVPSRDNPYHAEYYDAYDAYTALKNRWPAVTFSGSFQKRTDASMLVHSGLIGIDLDHLARSGLNPEAVRSACAQKSFTVAAFISPSGDGVKAVALVTPVPQTDVGHRRAFDQVVAAYADVAPVGVSDQSVKNPSRLCLLPHDAGRVFKRIEDTSPLEVDLSGPVPLSSPEPPPASVGNRPAHDLSDAEVDVDRDALRFVHPPDGGGGEEYNRWLAWLATLKALGFTATEVEAWSATGARYTQGEVLSRWDALPEDDLQAARDKLRGYAYNHGWRAITDPAGEPRSSDSESVYEEDDKGTDETYSRTLSRALSLGEPPWVALGHWFAERVAKHYIYYASPRASALWHYADHVWRVLPTTDHSLTDAFTSARYRLAKDLLDEGCRHLAEAVVRDKDWTANRARASDFWAGLRRGLRGPDPRPALHLLGTPDGVVDLKTGLLLPHDSSLGIRALTAGRYLPEQEAAHWRILENRLGRVFSSEVLKDFVKLAGLALTGLAQSHRAIVLVVGQSGSGKGGAVNTLIRAFGDRGIGVTVEWLERRGMSDIDAVTTDILERQPAAIAVGELGSDSSLVHKRVLSFTGNESINARRPHGSNLYGTLQAQLWSTAVKIPSFPRGTGIERRLAVLPSGTPLGAAEKDEEGGWSQELFDAVVTLACLTAADVYRPGYVAPAGPDEARSDVLSEMDPLATWLEDLPEEWHGQRMAAVLEKAKVELADPNVSATALGERVTVSARWSKKRTKQGGTYGPMRIYLKSATGMETL